jgi:FkbM family methyltransferase
VVTTRQKLGDSVAGACVLRDCVDIVPFLCGHYLRMGFAHLAFIDDGSTDGTYELLQRIAKRTSRVSVKQVHLESFEQSALMTEAVNKLIAAGHSIIVPFDCDEFWNAHAATFRSILAPSTEAVVEGHWVNFVQRRSVLASTSLGLFGAIHRAPQLPEANQERITAYAGSFLCFSIHKLAIKTASPIKIERGQHALAAGPREVCGVNLEILHLPFRSRAEILRRGLNYEPRRAVVREDRGMSWQSLFFAEAVTDGDLDAVWAAHSCDSRGEIDVYGKPLATAEDHRLRRILVSAGWHFLTRTGLSPLTAPLRKVRAALHRLRKPLLRAARVTSPDEALGFDRSWYLAAYPDVAGAGIDPYEHYETYGKGEGRHPTADAAEKALGFDRDWYLAYYPDLAGSDIDPYEHYKAYGKGEGRHPTATAAEEALGFDRAWYLGVYPDVAAAGLDPFRHWLDHGKAEGRHFNANFSFPPRQLAVLAKTYHYKARDAAPSLVLATSVPPPILPTPIFDSARYWRDRYRSGGNSGAGSYGRLANFKAEIVNAFVREHDVASVIEFGCGDGAQLTLADYPTYLGFDVADESVDLCRSKFANDSTKQFRSAATWNYERGDLAMSLDVIFHLIEDEVFHEYMRRLFFSANRYVIVYSSNHESEHPAAHVRHRRFTDWVEVYQADFKLIRHIANRWPLIDDDQSQSFADFFIFEKMRKRKHTLPGHLVLSLTSYRIRFPTLELTLRRILQQSIQPDETVLWVSSEDCSHLPKGVVDLQRSGLSIRETRDIRSYKKIIPTLERYPESFIITLDDDTAYPLDTVEPLVVNYRSPTEILCRRANRITFDDSGKPRPYNQWQFETPDETGSDLMASGVGGVLYPPHSLAVEVLDEANFITLAPFADDIWLFWMERLARSTVRRVGPRYALQPWPGCHEQGLWVNENSNGGNDRVIAALTARYGSPLGPGLVRESSEERGRERKADTLDLLKNMPEFMSISCDSSVRSHYKRLLTRYKIMPHVKFDFEGSDVRLFTNRQPDHLYKVLSSSQTFYEMDLLSKARSLGMENRVVFDVGANIGNHTVFFAKIMKATVFSFEPFQINRELLEMNVLVNSCAGVTIVDAALGEAAGRGSVASVDPANFGTVSIAADQQGGIRLEKLDTFVTAGMSVGLVKIDVEGGEMGVLKGATETLSTHKPHLFIEAAETAAFVQIESFLAGFGYRLVGRYCATPTYLFTATSR